MAIDAQQLEAFANPPKPGAPPDDAGEESAPEEQEGGEDRFSRLIPLLEEVAADMVANCDELDHEALMDSTLELDPQDEQILREGYDQLSRGFKKEFEAVGAISPEEAQSLADHLANEGMVDDSALMAGYLSRLSDMVHSGGEPSEGEGDESGVDEVLDEELD